MISNSFDRVIVQPEDRDHLVKRVAARGEVDGYYGQRQRQPLDEMPVFFSVARCNYTIVYFSNLSHGY